MMTSSVTIFLVLHSDLLAAKINNLAPTNIIMLRSNVAQVITSKLRAKKNSSIESFRISEKGLFVATGEQLQRAQCFECETPRVIIFPRIELALEKLLFGDNCFF